MIKNRINKIPQAIIFDLDGTILDTLPGIAAALNRVMVILNIPAYSLSEVRSMVGNGMRVLVERALMKYHLASKASQAFQLIQQCYKELWSHQLKAYPGMLELLDKLKRSSVPFGINTNKEEYLAKLMIESKFPELVGIPLAGRRDGISKKPNPTAALEMASAWGKGPEEVLYIGDSSVDLETASRGGFQCGLVDWGYGHYEKLKEHPKDYFFNQSNCIERLFC